jgi:hypothetical protein
MSWGTALVWATVFVVVSLAVLIVAYSCVHFLLDAT